MKKIIIIYLVLLLTFKVTAANRYTLYFLINVNSCSNCNLFSRDLLFNRNIFNNTTFLLSDQEVTQDQAKQYLNELFDTICTIELNDKLFSLFSEQISFFKMPHLIISDSTNKIVFQTPIDSIRLNISTIETYLQQRDETVLLNSRLRQLIGFKTITKVKNKLFITAYQQKEKVFIYNLDTRILDSIYLSDKILNMMLGSASIKNPDAAATIQFYKKNNFPYHLAEFGITPCTDGHYFYANIDIMYVDIRKKTDTVVPAWFPFLLKYDPVTSVFSYHKYSYFQSNPDPYGVSELKQDGEYKQYFNDSTWLLGADVKQTGYKKSKAILKFTTNSKTKELVYSSTQTIITADSLMTFTGRNMNNPAEEYSYKLTGSFLFFNQSPLIQNIQTKKVIDVRKFDPAINWIYDISIKGNNLYILTQKGKDFLLISLNNSDYSLIQTETITKNAKGNVELDGDTIYYMDKTGNIYISGH
ncbi:MAG: hypothetical protein WCO28_01400 [Bacteroidota bacterium]